MIIPPTELKPDILSAVIESYIVRDGTDYGEVELSLAQKVARLLPQVLNGDILIVFDTETESVTLMTKEQYQLYQTQQE